jgi:hypothetical protein
MPTQRLSPTLKYHQDPESQTTNPTMRAQIPSKFPNVENMVRQIDFEATVFAARDVEKASKIVVSENLRVVSAIDFCAMPKIVALVAPVSSSGVARDRGTTGT